MLFNSISFFIFLMLFLPFYFILKGRSRLLLSLIASYVFYAWWDYRFLFLILALTVLNYIFGSIISSSESPNKRKLYVLISVATSLLILGGFKYYNFFIDNLSLLLKYFGFDAGIQSLHIILPVGISFYTFQTMSYTLDIYRNKLEPEKSFLNFATFVAFFPQLVAGPIVRASCFLPQLREDRGFNGDNIIKGVHLIIWGFFLKVVVADSLALVVDLRFETPEVHNSLSMLIGVIFYAFQIYGDFAGYSLIAIGIARLLGYRFPINFDRPYFSSNVSEFWQRWHISLSTWLRDYLYIPLGGNRSGEIRMYRNLMITMLLGGLWHGASWNFIIWGGIHGSALILQKLWHDYFYISQFKLEPTSIIAIVFKSLNILLTFLVVCLAWVFFRSSDLNDSLYIIEKITRIQEYDVAAVTQKFHVIKGIMLISFLVLVEGISFKFDLKNLEAEHPYLTTIWFSAIIILIALFGTFNNSAFIYFQF